MMEPQTFDLDIEGTDIAKSKVSSSLPPRPGTNTAGKAVQIRVNQYKVTQFPSKDVYQFDVRTLQTPFKNIY
jgi:eukaryotic translation initiation factor 2C